MLANFSKVLLPDSLHWILGLSRHTVSFIEAVGDESALKWLDNLLAVHCQCHYYNVGETIKKDDIRRIRPGFGLPPKYIDQFINQKVIKNISRGDRVSWDVIDNTNIKM